MLKALAAVFAQIDGHRVIVLDRAPSTDATRPRLERLVALRELTRAAHAELFVKERADLARAVQADGLHLGEHGISSEDARRFGLRLSRACHDRAGLLRASSDLALLSPIAPPISGKAASGPLLGVDGFARAIAGLSVPVYALGGIEPDLIPALHRAGASGLAVLGGVFLAPDPGGAAAALLTAWDQAEQRAERAWGPG